MPRKEPLEIEVKFFLTDVDRLQHRLVDLGAASRGRYFETNIRFEDENNRLMGKNSLLRLRSDRVSTLTFKSAVPDTHGQFKIFKEYEVEVSDFATTCRILESVGFRRVQVYEKWRETFELDATTLCLDRLPFGDFIEIEGRKAAIVETAERIGLAWEERILTPYLEIFDILKKRYRLPFQDVTFENFGAHPLDFGAHLNRFAAGKTP